MTWVQSAGAYPLSVPQPRPQDSEQSPRPLVEPDRDIQALEARVVETPEDPHAWRDLGWAYWHRERLDLTRRTWESWRRLQPHRAEVHVLMGRLELADNRLRAAIDAFRRSLDLDPDQPDIRFELARTLRWNGNLIEAIERLQVLHTEQPDNEDITLELARALSSNWNYAQALPLWSALRAAHPGNLDIQLGEAQASLHTGAAQAAVIDARQVIRADPGNPTALTILADEAEFGGRPGDAAPWVEHLIAQTDDPDDRLFLQNRLLSLWRQSDGSMPERENLQRQERLARQMMADAPRNIDVHLSLAEILTRQQQFDKAETLLLGILGDMNPRHYRTFMMLYEIALARQRFNDADRYLEEIRRFNPQDPYLAWYEARLHAAAGRFTAAYRALDRLAAAGERGAVAVMLHHALTASDYGPPLSITRFRDHLRALMHAGYDFVTPETMHDAWDRMGPGAGRTADGRVRRLVSITFDDALESAMRFGTPVGVEYGIRFAQYIVSGFVERGDPYLSPWDDLARYSKSGIWEFGSHMYLAHDVYPIDSRGARGRPAAVRQWMDGDQRFETHREFALRMEHDFRRARELIVEKLGHPARAVAYPYGDIGQESLSNMPDAIPINLQHAANQHAIGFIQTPFAHAVRGANPLLYQRHEMNIHWDGERVVQYLIDHHPIILAERTRLQFAQWFGHSDSARQALDALHTAGYPSAALAQLANGLRTNMTPVFAQPSTATAPGQPTRNLGLTLNASGDNLKADHRRVTVQAGLALRPSIHLTALAGWGQLRQPRQIEAGATDNLSLTESLVEIRLAVIDPYQWVWTAGIGWREWSGDASGGKLHGQLSVHGRPSAQTALRLGVGSDTPEQAAPLAQGLSKTTVSLEGRWDPTAAWALNAGAGWDRGSDGNRWLRVELRPEYAPLDWHGYFTGARLTHRQSQKQTPGIWTPYRFDGGYAIAGRRGRAAGGQYDLSAHAGLGRETAFPVDTNAEDDASVNLEPPDTVDSDWTAAYGVGAGWRRNWHNGWHTEVRLDWSYTSNYDERRLSTGLVRSF